MPKTHLYRGIYYLNQALKRQDLGSPFNVSNGNEDIAIVTSGSE